ncbi:FkbM family methyltransferase [Patescibacteria group bacterium]|nr:FkbM family methyltransferase [Patescibacteria group bacterium]
MNNAEIVIENQKIRGIWRDQADESVWAEIFKYREYRASESAIKQAKTIFDIGAHAGFFTLYAKALNPAVKVVCVEPENNNIQTLNKNLELNSIGDGIKVISGALVPKAGRYVLKISQDSHNHQVASKAEGIPKELAQSVVGYTFTKLLKHTKTVSVDLLKMDIEGYEKDILEALTQDEWQAIRNIVLEYHGGDGQRAYAEAILRKNGFSVLVHPSQFDKTMGIIFARNKKV